MAASSPMWEKHFSKTYQKYYWFNAVDGTRVWERPDVEEEEELNIKKRPRDEGTEDIMTSTQTNPIKVKIRIAIIVPYRDVHVEQNRARHLARFIPEMTTFLRNSEELFRIYIIEQSNDQRRFNRGKLLNIGFDLARKDGCNIFIFHDVDLLPSLELLPYYTTIPENGAVHIARVWQRYSKNPEYFGGIVAFSQQAYEAINGFPNNFWGWGGEDDEMMKRVKKISLNISSPLSGSIEDMEEMTLAQKIDFLRQHSSWKNMKKWELLEEHSATWNKNGMSDLTYNIMNVSRRSEVCCIFTVDILLNNHWTDSDSSSFMS